MNIDELKKIKNEIDSTNKRIRKIILIIGCVLWGTGAIVSIIGAIILKEYVLLLGIFMFMFETGIPLLIVYFIWSSIANKNNYKKINEYSKAYKSEYVEKYLKEVFTDVKYNPNEGFTEDYLIKNSNAYLYDVFSSNDHMVGKYKNINVEFADVHIEEKREEVDSDGDTTTYYVTIFEGKWMIFDFNKNFKYNLIVSNKTHIMSLRETKNIKMEDENFNRVFSVYAANDEEAYYILTPHMMNKMRALYHKLGDKGVTFGFINNKLCVAFNTNVDSFEMNINKEISEESFKNDILKDIKEITNFIDDLDLTNNIFK